jgi:SOS-response transcriptional repressor LexA
MVEAAFQHPYLSAPQVKVLKALERLTAQRGYPPTVRELADAVGSSVGTVHVHLGNLRASGHVNWVDGSVRTLTICKAL